MRLTGLSTCLLALYSAGIPFVAAQQEAKPVSIRPSPVVYVEDFRQSAPIPEVDLSSFATSLVGLRLLEIPSLTVRRVTKAPECENPTSRSNTPTQLPGVPNFQSAAAPSGDFYVVSGSIGVRLPEIVLDYSVAACENRTSRKILQDTQPFTLDHAREELTIAAHAIGYKIEHLAPPTQIAVEPFQIEGNLQDSNAMQDSIRHQLIASMSKSPDFEVTDTSDYMVGGTITLQKGASLLRSFAKGKIEADLHIEAHGKPYPLRPLTGSLGDLDKFYAAVAEEVQHTLPQVLLAEHLGLPQILGNMEVNELVSKGSQLLEQCAQNDHNCASAGLAIPVLTSATRQDPNNWKAFQLLGQAQTFSGKYAGAAGSLQTASTLIKHDLDSGELISVSDQVQALNLLGDAYRNVEKYPQAEAAYDESLQIMPSQPTVYVSKALALRFDSKPLQSLQAILAGLKIAGSPTAAQPLHDAAKDVIAALQKDDFDKAEQLLAQAHSAGEPVSNEYALVLSRKWGQVLEASWTPENRTAANAALRKALDLRLSDPEVEAELYGNLASTQLVDGDRQLLDSYLTQAEKLPAGQVSVYTREWIARIIAEDQLEHHEYEKARASADLSYHIVQTDNGAYFAALTTYRLAESKNKPAGASPAEIAEVHGLYQQSADLAGPLVDKRSATNADMVFTLANHPLGQDQKTRERFERILKQYPNDVSALYALMTVCSQYLGDPDCAFSAARKWTTLPDGPQLAADYLDLAEIAVLADKDETASEWLDTAMSRPGVTSRDKSLAYIYRLWVAMRQKHTSEFSSDFQAWEVETQAFRKTKHDLSWIFTGARKALQDDLRIDEKEKHLLGAMMTTLDHPNQPLPSWPKAGLP
jgi:tetratricopeptide (TPR) repeat protein